MLRGAATPPGLEGSARRNRFSHFQTFVENPYQPRDSESPTFAGIIRCSCCSGRSVHGLSIAPEQGHQRGMLGFILCQIE